MRIRPNNTRKKRQETIKARVDATGAQRQRALDYGARFIYHSSGILKGENRRIGTITPYFGVNLAVNGQFLALTANIPSSTALGQSQDRVAIGCSNEVHERHT